MKHAGFLILVLGHLMGATLHAADGTPVWTNQFTSVGDASDVFRDIKLDGLGNVHVIGGKTDFGTSDYVTVKYSSAGAGLWSNLFNATGAGDNLANALALDEAGNVFVTGYGMQPDGQFQYDCVTIKYSNTGVPLWTNVFNGDAGGDDGGQAIAIADSGDVYVGGITTTTNGFRQAFGMGWDYLLIKYSNDGVALWTNRFDYQGKDDSVLSIGVDSSNAVMVTGTSYKPDAPHITIKYSSAGVALWTNIVGGALPDNGQPVGLALDVNGSALVLASGFYDGRNSVVTVKYSDLGVPLWTNYFNGGFGADFGKALALDASGAAIVAGISLNTDQRYDHVLIKYSEAGIPMWTNVARGNLPDWMTWGVGMSDLAVDRTGNVYWAATEDHTEPGYQTAVRLITTKYSTAGAGVWTNNYPQPSLSFAHVALAVDHAGSAYVTRTTDSGAGNGEDAVIIKYAGFDIVPSLSLAIGGLEASNNTLTVTGNPNFQYVLQFTTNLAGGHWCSVATNSPDANGKWIVVDSSPTNSQRFYRALIP